MTQLTFGDRFEGYPDVSPDGSTITVDYGGEAADLGRRHFVPADVVLAPAHGRAIRLAREARDRLVAGDVELPEIDLGRYDALVGAGS